MCGTVRDGEAPYEMDRMALSEFGGEKSGAFMKDKRLSVIRMH